MLRSSLVGRGAAAAALVFTSSLIACGGQFGSVARVAPVGSPAPSQAASTVDRMTVRTGDQVVVVDSPFEVGRRVERMIQEAGGYLERSTGSTDGKVRVVGRVPAQRLDSLMDSVAVLGEERRRQLTGADVTDQYADLEARLRSGIALRDRIQALLARATTLDEVLTLEKQIARLQAEIDGLEARIDQLRSQAALASLAVSLERRSVPGPLTRVGMGAVWLVSKLF